MKRMYLLGFFVVLGASCQAIIVHPMQAEKYVNKQTQSETCCDGYEKKCCARMRPFIKWIKKHPVVTSVVVGGISVGLYLRYTHFFERLALATQRSKKENDIPTWIVKLYLIWLALINKI